MLQGSKWLRNVSSLLSLTSKIVNCLHHFQRNVFLEERKGNVDCSSILTSLTKICLHARYRTIIGLENLIQKEWFLAGHLFFKRMATHKRSREGSDDFSLQNDNESDTISMQQTESVNGKSGNGSGEIAPTFLLFLDCLFQLTLQYPNEFEFNEFYLIKLWDYSCSGLSLTYSFNGVTDWLTYLNNQKFLDNSAANFPIDSVSVSTLPRGSLPKFENIYLKLLFEANNAFWVENLGEGEAFWKNRSFKANHDLILIPVERIYMLKFWSRCYLRWYEKYHAYWVNDHVEKSPSMQPTRPPPLPPKPKSKESLRRLSSTKSEENTEDFEELTVL